MAKMTETMHIGVARAENQLGRAINNLKKAAKSADHQGTYQQRNRFLNLADDVELIRRQIFTEYMIRQGRKK